LPPAVRARNLRLAAHWHRWYQSLRLGAAGSAVGGAVDFGHPLIGCIGRGFTLDRTTVRAMLV